MKLTIQQTGQNEESILVIPDAHFHPSYYESFINKLFPRKNLILVDYEFHEHRAKHSNLVLEDISQQLNSELEESSVVSDQMTVLGHSMGGKIAINLANKGRPLKSLILANTAILPIEKVYKEVILLTVQSYLTGEIGARELAKHAASNLFPKKDFKKPHVNEWIAKFESIHPEDFWLQAKLAIQYNREDEILKRLKLPILFMYGTSNKVIPGAQIDRILLQKQLNIVYREVDKASHSFFKDDLYAITESISSFMEKIIPLQEPSLIYQ